MARPRLLDFAADPEPTTPSVDGKAARATAAGSGADGMSDEDFKKYIEDRLTDSMGAVGSLIAFERMRNLEAYIAEPTGEWEPPEIADRSDVVSTEVADTIEWTLPSILRVFASNKGAIEATAKRPQYEAAASLVTQTLRWAFWEQMKGLIFLHAWAKDGLLQKVGFARVTYRRTTHVSRERYEGLTFEQVQMLAENDNVSIVGKAERDEVMDGQPFKVFDVELEISEPEGAPLIVTVPPDEMRIDSAASYGEQPKFIGREYSRRRSELEAEGYDVEGISSDSGVNAEQSERRRINSFSRWDDDEEDPLLRVVDGFVRLGTPDEPRWEWGMLIGDQLFKREEVEDHDFVWWCPEPMPHVFFGNCPADRAIEPQRLRTRLLRAVDDNVALTVNGRTGIVDGEVNIDDVLDSRPGGLVRMRTRDSMFPLAQPDMSAAAWQAMEWAERWNGRRTGFSELSKGLNSEALNDTATGVMEITERADMRVEMMCRHMAAALEVLLAKVLRCMSRHQDVEQQIRIAGKWVAIDPREWANHYSISVNVGLGAGNKDRQVAQYTTLSARQDALAQRGLVPPPAQVELARKLARAMGEESPEVIFPDAVQPPPPPPPLPILVEQEKARAAQAEAAAKQQADMARMQAEHAHQYAMKQLELDARHRERLFELAAGVMAAQARAVEAASAPTNLINGTQLDQVGQAPGITVPGINQVAAGITAVADAIGAGGLDPNTPPLTQ